MIRLGTRGSALALWQAERVKAAKLYDFIDGSNFYANPVDKAVRSRMNVPFTLADDSLNSVFLEEAGKAGMVQLKGHRAVGGMRASIYNAMPEAGVDALLVGDSLGNVILGQRDTMRVSVDDMVHHTRAVTSIDPKTEGVLGSGAGARTPG